MADIVKMTRLGIEGEQKEMAWEYEVTLSSVTTSDAILLPRGINGGVTTISFTGTAEGKVQSTSSSFNTIRNGTAIWVDWDAGVVTVTTQDAFSPPPTAIRLNQTSAGGGADEATLSLVAQ